MYMDWELFPKTPGVKLLDRNFHLKHLPIHLCTLTNNCNAHYLTICLGNKHKVHREFLGDKVI
jgi:hypothetical protein